MKQTTKKINDARILPHSIEAEQCVLGCAFIDQDASYNIVSGLKVDDFYSETHQIIFEAMQKVMDEYAGGISTNYQFNEKQLALAEEKIEKLTVLANEVTAENMHELLFAYELKERLIVCKSLIAHLKARKETRWHSFNENLDYPDTDENYYKYVNSKLENGEIKIIFRDIVKGAEYEHQN